MPEQKLFRRIEEAHGSRMRLPDTFIFAEDAKAFVLIRINNTYSQVKMCF